MFKWGDISYINQIKAYHDGCRFKINRMIKLKNPKKKNKNPNIEEGWKKSQGIQYMYL